MSGERTTMPPEAMSEISARLTTLDDQFRVVFAMESLTLTGDEIEKLVVAAWSIGYGECLGDIADGPGPYPKLPPLAQVIEDAVNA